MLEHQPKESATKKDDNDEGSTTAPILETEFNNATKYGHSEMQGTRTQVAREIREGRTAYFERQTGLMKLAEEIKKNIETQTISLEAATEQIRVAESQLYFRESEILSWLYDTERTRELLINLDASQQDEQSFRKEIASAIVALEVIEEAISEKYELGEARKKLDTYKITESAEWQKYEAENKMRDLATVALRNNVILIHAINEGVVSGVQAVKSGTTWHNKLDVLIGLTPSISASTIKEGDRRRNMWGGAGVILKGGHIDTASISDANTSANGLQRSAKQPGEFGHEGSKETDKNAVEAIDWSITNRPNNLCNEFIVRRPEVVALYFYLPKELSQVWAKDPSLYTTYFDAGTNPDNPQDVASFEKDVTTPPLTEMLQEGTALGLPVYFMTEGLLYEMTSTVDDKGAEVFIRGREVVKPEISKLPTLEKEAQILATERVFTETPFSLEKLQLVDGQLVESYNDGRDAYFEFHKSEIEKTQDGDAVAHIIPHNYNDSTYSMKNGRLTKESTSLHDAWSGGFIIDEHLKKLRAQSFGEEQKRIKLGFRGCIPTVPSGNYFDAVRQSLTELDNEQKKESLFGFNSENSGGISYLKGEKNPGAQLNERIEQSRINFRRERKLLKDTYHEKKKSIALNLYGYAREARIFGDDEGAIMAESMATLLLSKEDFEKFSERRMATDGRFKLLPSDIGAKNRNERVF
ncbi:MAG: hypothetical protein Q8Q18_01745 [bacterium]|nr:hypothetical protein [bacterium]